MVAVQQTPILQEADRGAVGRSDSLERSETTEGEGSDDVDIAGWRDADDGRGGGGGAGKWWCLQPRVPHQLDRNLPVGDGGARSSQSASHRQRALHAEHAADVAR